MTLNVIVEYLTDIKHNCWSQYVSIQRVTYGAQLFLGVVVQVALWILCCLLKVWICK